MDKEIDPRDVTRHVHVMLNLSNSTYTSENVKKIIMDPLQKFDAVIGEWLFSEISSG